MKMTLFISPSDKPGIRLAHYVLSNDEVSDERLVEVLTSNWTIDSAQLQRSGVFQWPGRLVDSAITIKTVHFE